MGWTDGGLPPGGVEKSKSLKDYLDGLDQRISYLCPQRDIVTKDQ